MISTLIDFVLHIDTHLIQIVNNFGDSTYLILFAIIFIETGAVILPFLPGDSLLFAASALTANAQYHLNIFRSIGPGFAEGESALLFCFQCFWNLLYRL